MINRHWIVVKKNNGVVITDGENFFKACPDKQRATALANSWTIAKISQIPVPVFKVVEIDARELTRDKNISSGLRWGLLTKAVRGGPSSFYQLSKVNKVNSAFTAICSMPLNHRKRILNMLRTAREQHMMDTQFFLRSDRIIFIDISFEPRSHDPHLAELINRLEGEV